MFSYIESRGGLYPQTLFFGLQYLLKEYLSEPISVADVEEAKEFLEAHGEPFNYEGWMYIATELGGKLPVRIRAVPEGTIVPTQNILVSIESTDSKVFWVASWLETMLLRGVWYPTTVATRSWTVKQTIMAALEKSSDDPDGEIPFKLHDFSARGVSSDESAAIGGAAHLVNFMGSDTVSGVLMANRYYNCTMAGFSIPAGEHSAVTSWSRENEVKAYRNMIKQFAKPGKTVAIVSDSYDLWNACSNLFGEELREEIIASGATVVIRPDSGHPATVVLKTIKLLDEKFGHKLNSKDYKVLNHVRVIQGDGINEESVKEILNTLLGAGYSATNLAFGMGGGLLQQNLDRDTNKWAMKCSSVTTDGKEVDVYKDPITDSGKQSKRGRLDLQATATGSGIMFNTVRLCNGELECEYTGMRTVYENGVICIEDTFDDVRARTCMMRTVK